MPGPNSRYAAVGEETAYATAVAASRSFEVRNDDFAVVAKPVEVGETTRAGQQAELAHNWQQTLEKVTGTFDLAWYRSGIGLLLKNLLGEATAPVAVTSSTNNRFGRTYRSTSDGDTTSLTIRRGRSRRLSSFESEEIEEFIYAGCIISGAELAVSADNPWTFKPTFVGASEAVGGAATAQLYASTTGQTPFSWHTTGLTIGGNSVDEFGGLSLNMNYNVNDAIKTLNNSANIRKPLRKGIPTLEGNLSAGIYSADVANDLYSAFRSGESVSIVAECKARPPGYTTNPPDDHSLDILRLTLASCVFTGNTPQGAPGSETMIEMPFKVQFTGASSAHAVEIYLQNSERADT